MQRAWTAQAELKPTETDTEPPKEKGRMRPAPPMCHVRAGTIFLINTAQDTVQRRIRRMNGEQNLQYHTNILRIVTGLLKWLHSWQLEST